jgi:V/A-type H+-transporting ATPase subunit E
MALEHLKESLLAEARAEADTIVAEARAKAAERLKAAEDDRRAAAEARYRARLEALDEAKRQTLARARIEARLRVLDRKNALVERAFAEAMERLNSLGDEQYLPLVEKWLGRLDGLAGGEVTVSAADRDRVSDLLSRANARRPDAPLALSAQPLPSGRGFVFRSHTFLVDCTVSSQVASLRDGLLPEVARVLFTPQAEAP